jgi:hypothetical protein
VRHLFTIFALIVSVVFYKAPRVKAGETPNSRQMIGLANAANVKLRSGLGDFHWRERQWLFNIGRQIRNPDELGAFPAQGEWNEFYAYIKAKFGAPYFPAALAGDFEGANVTSPIPAFIFGNEDANFFNEEGRLSEVPLWLFSDAGIGFPTTPEGQWNLAKQQRGVIDPNTGAQAIPAISAARSSQRIHWTSDTPHAKNYGSFQPIPVEALPECGAIESSGLLIPSYEIKMTALRTGVAVPSNHGTLSTDAQGRSVITYAGSCPDWTDNVADGHVQDIQIAGGYWIVFVFSGGDTTFDLYPLSEWIHGFYTGDGKLQRHDGGHYSRMIWAFVKDFRGTLAQRAKDDYEIEKLAFSFDEFFKRQYHLAPNLGFDVGDEIVTVYPRATVAADSELPGGSLLKFNVDQSSHTYTNGFVMSGMFAKATNLFEPITLEVLSGSKVVATLTLTPAEPEVTKYLTTAVKPEPLSVRVTSGARFTAPGEIIFEANELLEYTPNHFDAYLLLRLMATAGGSEGENPFLDGSGFDCETAAQLFKNYEKHGCVVNTAAAGVRTLVSAINANPVYDSMRRVMNEMFHTVHRREFLTYERDGQGRPVMRFKRYALGNHWADQFQNIAPSDESVESVIEGVEYVVRSHTGGYVIYGGTRFNHEQRFIGGTIKDFEANGDALLLEYEGIKPNAPKGGWSNEWLMSEEFHFYHPSDTSLWKESAYADWFTVGNRCHAYASNSTPGFPKELARVADIYPPHLGDGYRNLHLSPEVPSGYNFALGANSFGATDDFCKSCQVYVAPYEVISATVEFDAAGNDVVKLVFKEPFQADASAPSSWNQDAGSWSSAEVAALRAEPYRTTDNGLREYMLYQATNTHGSWKKGDSASWSDIQVIPDNPFGAIMPRFFFTSLVRKPYEDGNDIYDLHDSRITIDEFFKLEIRLNAWCEGAIDGFSTQPHICDGGTRPYDFSFASLCFNTVGKLYLGRGHGPMVNTELDAQTFNEFAACLDELYMFRLEGLMQFEIRTVDYVGEQQVQPTWGNAVCPPLGTNAAIWEGTPPGMSLVATGIFAGPAFGMNATSGAGLSSCQGATSSGPSPWASAFKQDIEYRYVAKSGYTNALSPNVQNLISNRAVGVWGTITRTTNADHKVETSVFSETSCSGSGGPGAFWNGSSGWKFENTETVQNESCVFLTGGTLSAGDPPPASFAVCTYPDGSVGSGTAEIPAGSSSASAVFNKLNEDDSAIIVVPMEEPLLV